MEALQQEIQGMVQQFQALVNQLQQAQQQAPQQQQPPAAPAPIFALTPAQINPDQFIDYTNSDGKKLWKAATTPLEEKYDADPKDLNLFVEEVVKRATIAGWNAGQGNIISVPDAQGNNRNLLTEYGRLTLEDIRTFVSTYSVAAAGQPAPQNRCRQNDYQLYVFLSDSLSKEGQLKLLAETDSYSINGNPSGSLFYKLLMQKAIVDTRATASHLRENLTNLDSYISTVDSNIRLFNQYVKVNREGLKARGESTDDIMVNLFKGYLNAADREFIDYNQQQKGNGKKGNKNKQRQKQDEELKKKPPADGEPTVKTVKGKSYYWCPEHMAWTMHKPDDCRLKDQRTNQRNNGSSTNNTQRSSSNPGPRTTINQAMTAIMEELAENEDSDSDDE